ncbi:hypothetical protein BLA29_000891 [Euroglyphus maynei]|uniref:Uncharacterized protein n=1 Tax=Euroglyphus maynei TaxID=6958 RepID=A0A1Y3AW30_EURMA|nr:hypothetical protein BLA29_000891 [Euroglyphus maynei]
MDSAKTEMNHIFQSLLVDLKENFSEEFDQLKLYKNVAVIEKNGEKLLEKYNCKMADLNLKLNEQAIQCENKLGKDLNMDDESIDVLMKIIAVRYE